jgi:hypothetical protein
MSAIELCRTAGPGSPAAAHLRPDPSSLQFLAQSALPEAPGADDAEWLTARQAELLPVPYFHVVFTLPDARRRDGVPQGSALRRPLQGPIAANSNMT